MNIYTGERTIDGVVVRYGGKLLPTYADIVKFSDGGFEWGYEGNAPLQLAFAIVYSRTRNLAESRSLAHPMMKEIVANLENEWEMPVELLDEVISELMQSKDSRQI
ncbi:DUF6166 domain-containing protein [Noviherbaspirillum sp. CPCC 100848]|jgi:hypothetical protein|uniref:DUF6166 domain-containing protein n=1 Tax=Noviherbaspirillum album TaxID=3080276 RepID=A0ABU6J3Y8_9BURK|nr:DUF6166 domain-containing protein [Noviherbaspirillum sp. CPCC 100848]MEC4718325.1 DUF6166 domain-containing protein [Noviherbaspirillum sp. CPCC 100848]